MIHSTLFRSVAFVALTMAALDVYASGTTRIFFSGYFSAYLPTQSLDGATFFSSDGPGIKFSDGSHLAGTLITREREGFDPTFELRDYPLYLFGLKDPDELGIGDAEKFLRSHEELKSSLGDPVFEVVNVTGATFYSACSDRCEAIVVQDAQDEHLLHITSRGLSKTDIMTFLQDGNHAAD